LGDRFDEFELAGAGQDETPHPAVGIDDTLQIGKEFGNALDLVENGPIGRQAEEGPGVLRRKGAGIGIFEREVGKMRREEAGKGGFPGLPGAGDRQNGKSGQPLTRRCNRDPGNRMGRNSGNGRNRHVQMYSQ
jgi:hypothetical protein